VAAVFLSQLHGDHFGGLPFLILDGQFAGRDQPLTVAGPVGTAQRLTEAMECLFPGPTGVARRFAVEVVELPPYHLRLADLTRNAGRLASRHTVLTHMSADLLSQLDQMRPELDEVGYLAASDGLVLHI
jgi:ribonuclease BN (tRNA processing enzyme)